MVKNKELIELVEGSRHSTVHSVKLNTTIPIQKTKVDQYRKEARTLLDQLSQTYNNLGIDGLIAALLLETVGDENYGCDNL